MTFKLNKKDIKVIEALVSSHVDGVSPAEIAQKFGISHKAAVNAFVGCLRRLHIEIPYQQKGIRAGSERAKIFGDSIRARWAALRANEAREAAR